MYSVLNPSPCSPCLSKCACRRRW